MAPRLKEPYLSGYYETTLEGWLDAREIVQSDWVCQDLEVFHCRIGNIPRPEITRTISTRAATGSSDGHQEPRPLSGNKEYWRQYDCLAMTLESGLDILKNLGNLRTVGLEDMEIYIDGDKEQSWFAESWPHSTTGETDYTADAYNAPVHPDELIYRSISDYGDLFD
ncbi:hypothetical protein K457DRAFT_34923 [Linnemannia elongata AG-77]|uniref:Uncharacterized protein n=1 Tax=Linnemannia elongata AG-77 TaxID=1314771 RepID=A0A197JN51_9FUNG|nr:hypothetical protein K457DRAFT_34923 [Linnemannia elongata AG-77]